jgi:Flp pilus assembly protein TadG
MGKLGEFVKSKHTHRRESGQELIEFSLVLVVLLLIIFGIFDIGRIFHATVVLTNAARSGARYGARDPSNFSALRTAVKNETNETGILVTDADIGITCTLISGACASGFSITVTVNYKYTPSLGFAFPNQSFNLSRSVEMLVP